MKSVIIQGSARRDGNTTQIIKILQTTLNADVVFLSDKNIGHFDYNFNNQNDDFIPTLQNLLQYDYWIFATPIYWYAMSGHIKVFMDRISDCLKVEKEIGRQMKGKSMAALCCGSDNHRVEGFFVPFERSADYLGMHYLGDLHTYIETDFPNKTVLKSVSTFGEHLASTVQK